jgi:hypothetical protein
MPYLSEWKGKRAMMDYRAIVILGGIGAVALLWLLLRFGRHIARAALVVGILAAVIIGALALLSQASATREAASATRQVARAATVAASGQVVVAFCFGAMGAVTLGALGCAGFWWVRFRLLAQRHKQRPRRQRALSQKDAPEIVYIAEDEADPLPLDGIDLSLWGWG